MDKKTLELLLDLADETEVFVKVKANNKPMIEEGLLLVKEDMLVAVFKNEIAIELDINDYNELWFLDYETAQEVVEEDTKPNYQQLIKESKWLTRQGLIIPIKEMDTEYIANVFKFINREIDRGDLNPDLALYYKAMYIQFVNLLSSTLMDAF